MQLIKKGVGKDALAFSLRRTWSVFAVILRVKCRFVSGPPARAPGNWNALDKWRPKKGAIYTQKKGPFTPKKKGLFAPKKKGFFTHKNKFRYRLSCPAP